MPQITCFVTGAKDVSWFEPNRTATGPLWVNTGCWETGKLLQLPYCEWVMAAHKGNNTVFVNHWKANTLASLRQQPPNEHLVGDVLNVIWLCDTALCAVSAGLCPIPSAELCIAVSAIELFLVCCAKTLNRISMRNFWGNPWQPPGLGNILTS